jgi:hypothetical protein
MLRICACSYSFIVHSLIKGMRRLHVQYFWPSSTCTSMRLIIEHETRGDRFFPFVGHVATHLRQNLIRMLSVDHAVCRCCQCVHACTQSNHGTVRVQCVWREPEAHVRTRSILSFCSACGHPPSSDSHAVGMRAHAQSMQGPVPSACACSQKSMTCSTHDTT